MAKPGSIILHAAHGASKLHWLEVVEVQMKFCINAAFINETQSIETGEVVFASPVKVSPHRVTVLDIDPAPEAWKRLINIMRIAKSTRHRPVSWPVMKERRVSLPSRGAAAGSAQGRPQVLATAALQTRRRNGNRILCLAPHRVT